MNDGWICPICGTSSHDDYCDVCKEPISDDFYYEDPLDYDADYDWDIDFEDAF